MTIWKPSTRILASALPRRFTDKDFIGSMYAAQSKDDILNSLDTYVQGVRVLPRTWQADNVIEPPAPKAKKIGDELEEIDEDRRMREASGLVRTGRWFGGLVDDIKRKKPFYISDFFHAMHPQCISSFMFLYFACLAPIVAFGGLLGEATENRIATIESLISGNLITNDLNDKDTWHNDQSPIAFSFSGLISGVLFGLFSGQPLILLGSTGPVYVFEKILYQMCTHQKLGLFVSKALDWPLGGSNTDITGCL